MNFLVKNYRKAYDRAIFHTLNYYEAWVLPDMQKGGFQKRHRVSLRQTKLQEFRERKKLLHPYQKDLLISSVNQEEQLRLHEQLKSTNFDNMHDFTITFNRHEDLYSARIRDFPDKYYLDTSVLTVKNDTDYSVKVLQQRFRVRFFMYGAIVAYCLFIYRRNKVYRYDSYHRKEQRAMQNKEIEEVEGKKARFVLFDNRGEQFNEASVLNQSKTQPKYYVLWYDRKMKNYQLLEKYLLNSKQVQAEIQPILIVDEQIFMDKVLEIWADNEKVDKYRAERYKVLLKRDLSDEESLMHSFGDSSNTQNTNDSQEEQDEEIDLDIKQGFFYVMNPECRIVDCAKIYSFLHEENIFKRIIAKTCKDADIRINKK